MSADVKKNILVVEDEENILKDISQTIGGFGYGVFTANTGEKAVEIGVNNESINLIIMDINLGNGIDGTEAARIILSKRNVPIVFFTSTIDQELVEKVSGITRYGYVLKNSGEFILKLSIEMAFELFEANRKNEETMESLLLYRNNLEELVLKRTQEVQASEARYRLIADFAVDWESYSNVSGEITYLNKGFERITGYTVEERLLNKVTFEDLCFTEDLPAIQEKMDEVFVHKKIITNFQHRIKHKNGSVRYVSLSSTPVITDTGSFAGVRSSIRDITELKKMEHEKMIRDNYFINIQKLVSLSSLSSAIAHEIRQPLQLIKVLTDTILLRYKKNSALNEMDRKNQGNLIELSNGVLRIDKIIDSMYRLFKTSDKVDLQYLNIDSIMENMVKSYKLKNNILPIEIELVMQKYPSRIYGDEILIEQVVTNIINNAVDALNSVQDDGKKITIRTWSESNDVIMEISNNGPLIPEHIKDKIFDPLITTKKNPDSMGMGLFLVQNIVKAMNGKIEVYVNELNETTFRIVFH